MNHWHSSKEHFIIHDSNQMISILKLSRKNYIVLEEWQPESFSRCLHNRWVVTIMQFKLRWNRNPSKTALGGLNLCWVDQNLYVKWPEAPEQSQAIPVCPLGDFSPSPGKVFRGFPEFSRAAASPLSWGCVVWCWGHRGFTEMRRAGRRAARLRPTAQSFSRKREDQAFPTRNKLMGTNSQIRKCKRREIRNRLVLEQHTNLWLSHLSLSFPV